MSNAAPDTRLRLLKRLTLLAVAITCSAIAAEVASRIYLRLDDRPYRRHDTELAFEAILQAMTGLAAGVPTEKPAAAEGKRTRNKPDYKLHPYTGYNHRTGLKKMHEAVEHFRAPGASGEFSVFIQGGSVAAGFQVGGAPSLTHYLERLSQAEGRPVRVFGLAVPGFKQPQQLLQLTYLLSQGCAPDMIINLDGLNELRISINNGTRGLEPAFPGIAQWSSLAAPDPLEDEAARQALVEMISVRARAVEAAERALAGGHTRSALLGTLALSRLRRAHASWATAQQSFSDVQAANLAQTGAAGLGEAFSVEQSMERSIQCWLNSSLAMHELCTARGIRYVHLLQPTLHDTDSKPVSNKERRVGFDSDGPDPGVVAGYPRLRAGLVELRERGVEALDTSDAFQGVTESLYIDSCHFNRRGHQLLGERAAILMEVDSERR